LTTLGIYFLLPLSSYPDWLHLWCTHWYKNYS